MAQGKYFAVNDVRDILDVEDTLDDSELKTYGVLADDDIEMRLSPFTPVPLIGDLFSAAKRATLFYVAAAWKRKRGNFEASQDYMNNYHDIVESMITLAQTVRTIKTKRVSVGTEYQTDTLFSQKLRF